MSISLILDIAVVAILLLCLIIGGSRGFLRSPLGVGILAADRRPQRRGRQCRRRVRQRVAA